VHVTLWEDDAPGAGHSETNKNNKAVTKSERVANGVANVKFKLAVDFAKIANAHLAGGDKSEGKNHEYYVTAEIFRQKTESSNNINVINPDKNGTAAQATPQKPSPRPTDPAAKKGPSKKEEKGIVETVSGTIYDWGETILKAIPIILPDPIEVVNSLAKIFTPDKGDEKGKETCGEKYCIKKGDKSELIREVNIRLAGFGGNVPTDEFTDRTEKMIKQFQRDYMKVSETGKICGNVLKAIDEFSQKFDISQTVWSDLDCSCTTKGTTVSSSLRVINELNNCKGWGDGTGKGTYKIGNAEKDHKYEYPGIHRSLLFGFKAMLFYLNSHPTYKFRQISSGYRCRFKNYMTTNHQGKAIDIQFKDTGDIGGALQSNIPKLKTIREDIFYKYLDSKTSWINGTNKFCLEPIALIYKPNGSIDQNYTYSWIHFDVREFEAIYLEDKYFCKNKDGLNGVSIIQLAKLSGFEKTCNCFANKETKNNEPTKPLFVGNCEDKFKKVAPIILQHEGGYKNEPSKDKGDPTNKGISWPVWVKYAKSDLNVEATIENQKNLTEEQATIIYRKRYWEPKGYCEIEDLKIALMVYDWSITSGGAIKEIQKLLVNEYSQTITIDGGMGKNTAQAINEASKKGDLLNRIAEIRREYYKKGADAGWFSDDYSKGLDNRVTKCLNYEL
jgi:lysozyme family protein